MYQKKPEDRLCKICGVRGLPDGSNLTTRNKRKYFRSLCKQCGFKRLKDTCHNIPYRERSTEYKREFNLRRSNKRNGNPSYILSNCRNYDKKHGFQCDLDLQFIIEETKKDCVYCGASNYECLVTLDRIDNSLGHTKNNSLPACRRCNLTRGNMPYEAWLIVAKGMKIARELGLFKDWVPGNKRILISV